MIQSKLSLKAEFSRLWATQEGDHTIHQFTSRWNTDEPLRTEIWKTQRSLGHGSYGQVRLQECIEGAIDGPTLRAVKYIPGIEGSSTSRVDWSRELEAILRFSHQASSDYFVRSFGWYTLSESLYITMEYLEYGDLYSYLRTSPPLLESEAQEICFQLLTGLRLMHDENIAHRDLKPNNILIKTRPPKYGWWVKIGDFGLSKRLDMPSSQPLSIKGTEGYIAPEIYRHDEKFFDAKPADIWASGAILFFMVRGGSVFGPGGRELWKYVDGYTELPSIPLSENGINFFQGLMARDPAARLTAEQAISHDWMKDMESSLPTPVPSPSPGEEKKPNSFYLPYNFEDTGSAPWTNPLAIADITPPDSPISRTDVHSGDILTKGPASEFNSGTLPFQTPPMTPPQERYQMEPKESSESLLLPLGENVNEDKFQSVPEYPLEKNTRSDHTSNLKLLPQNENQEIQVSENEEIKHSENQAVECSENESIVQITIGCNDKHDSIAEDLPLPSTEDNEANKKTSSLSDNSHNQVGIQNLGKQITRVSSSITEGFIEDIFIPVTSGQTAGIINQAFKGAAQDVAETGRGLLGETKEKAGQLERTLRRTSRSVFGFMGLLTHGNHNQG